MSRSRASQGSFSHPWGLWGKNVQRVRLAIYELINIVDMQIYQDEASQKTAKVHLVTGKNEENNS